MRERWGLFMLTDDENGGIRRSFMLPGEYLTITGAVRAALRSSRFDAGESEWAQYQPVLLPDEAE